MPASAIITGTSVMFSFPDCDDNLRSLDVAVRPGFGGEGDQRRKRAALGTQTADHLSVG